MRLAQIKLAGFKSFVDPTHLHIPGQIVGIVGPNGCGKSNIIDALRWVLGESRAGALRGDSMQDVIFNGSQGRKPVARASVELVFDNAEGRAGGQWSRYAEIAVKRVLSRDSESSYFINNVRVRKKDVTDIFLGTGLGARAYAIIEQGMISRIIEANPVELRVFLEEAAGISRYRERRRETEHRLDGARENLLRVGDILGELEQQMLRLDEQAQKAAHYRELKLQRETAQNLLWLHKRNQAWAAANRLGLEAARIETEIESETTRLQRLELDSALLREQQHSLADELQQAQGALYQSDAEVARIEQQIDHVNSRRERVEEKISSEAAQLGRLEAQRREALDSLEKWRASSVEAQYLLEAAAISAENEQELLPAAEDSLRNCRARLSASQQQLMKLERDEKVEEANLVHVRRNHEQLIRNIAKLEQEKAALARPDESALDELRLALESVGHEKQSIAASLGELSRKIPADEMELAQIGKQISASESELSAIRARLAALTEMQRHLDQSDAIGPWLNKLGLGESPRAWQLVSIEPGWEVALEAVLRERLNALPASSLDAIARAAPPGAISLIDRDFSGQGGGQQATLFSLIECRDQAVAAALEAWTGTVFTATDLEQALARRTTLEPGQALVTREGHLLTRHGIDWYAPDTKLHGVLERRIEIEQLGESASELAQGLESRAALHAEKREQLAQSRARAGELQREVGLLEKKSHSLELQLLQLSQAIEQARSRAGLIDSQLEESRSRLSLECDSIIELEIRIDSLREAVAKLREQWEALKIETREAEHRFNQQKNQVFEAARKLQERQFAERECVGRIDELGEKIRLFDASIGQNRKTLDEYRAELSQLDASILAEKLQGLLAIREERAEALRSVRVRSEAMQASLREHDEARVGSEKKLHPLREKLTDARLKEQEARLGQSQYVELLSEAGADESSLAPLLDGAKPSALQAQIAQLDSEILALGAVNLAALDELTAARERKSYLDSQMGDLTEAVETLESAIRRIDRETRERLEATFAEVNRHFSELFTLVFGGGQARLVQTGEEIIDGGVEIVAQPPGKKNASIHLLSGGEKALTALSLVFSLFSLNPAPFCLLDEVDAPLDDSNTVRFCDMVRKMAERTQFLFISHNKISMEMAQQLIGVTMQEQGVSRIVAVDIELAAAELAV